MMERLIKAGADPNSPFGRENPLYEAASRGQNETVAILVEQGAVVDPDDRYRIPLVAAASYGFTSTVKLLHSLGASIEAGHEWGQTALMEATYDGYEATVALLLKLGARTEEKDDHGRVPLWIATKNRHMNTVKLLLRRGQQKEENTLRRYWNRTYWTRAWSLPEIVIAGRMGIVMCGNLSCEWTTLKYGMPLYTFYSNIWPPEIFNSRIVADSGPQAEILFEDVVSILHTLEVTDPRDQMFASLGLVLMKPITVGKILVEFPVADYILSVQQVFVHAVRYMIEVCEVSPFRDGESSFRLDIKEDSTTTETSLRIRGCIVDKVVFKLTLTRDLEILTILSLVVDALANPNRGTYDTYPIGEGFDVNNNVARSEKERVDEGSSMKSTNAMALFVTITYFDEEKKGTIPERVLPLLAGCLIWTLSMNTNTPGLSKTAPEYAERFAEKWAQESGDNEAFVDFELDNLKLVEDVLRVDKDLIYTENGFFGLTNPDEAEVGMVLAMVECAHTLRLLRKKDDTTSLYEYVDMVFLNTMGQEVDKVGRMFRDVALERLEIR
ncbi:ankyrin repeat domain-containing protein [Fusarium sporotrichioides]|uniref:Ankyrin repeat domain-containing protein n=1 Tax=Fusarium sporotrichioides TaxID=5514 RepID=A0A395RHB1_FUSSP|nr:ankyrin repeat domain-containing protein [Fusarium sporotrichioides]